MDRQGQHQSEDADRCHENHPADKQQHCVAQRTEKLVKRLTRGRRTVCDASANSRMNRISGIIAPDAAAAMGLDGSSEVSQPENVWACPAAVISPAASARASGS